jgi:hypothetical protein
VQPDLTSSICSACPSSFHEFEGPDPIPYDVEGVWVSLALDIVEEVN